MGMNQRQHLPEILTKLSFAWLRRLPSTRNEKDAPIATQNCWRTHLAIPNFEPEGAFRKKRRIQLPQS
jgi:hypothetical protein